MDCPRCGLVNPEIAQRCDCGYDFEKETMEKPYHTIDISQEKPVKLSVGTYSTS